jgi:hypothetical protein
MALSRGSPSIFILTLLSLVSAASATNWTEQHHFCKTNASIDNLQHLYNLTLVTSVPTHAALHPGWPETLVTLFICIYSVTVFTVNGRDGFDELGWLTFIGQFLIPFILLVDWIISFFVAEKTNEGAGWVSVNLLSYFSLVCVLTQLTYADDSGFDGSQEAAMVLSQLVAILGFLIGKIQFFGSLIVMGQRWSSGLGSVAYNITDTNGCMPHHGLAYLEKGARSHAFKSIQTVQVVWAYLVLITLFVVMCNMDKGDDNWVFIPKILFPSTTIIISIPVLIYQAVIAAQGRPVAISGTCMLVELDPRWGFLDSEIETFWKVLVGISGL